MKKIELTHSIIISQDYKTVFEYVANYAHDALWRKEINRVEIDTAQVGKGTQIKEESLLSKKVPNHINLLQCTDFQEYKAITSETTNQSMFWVKNTRAVEPLGTNQTKLTYYIAFDTAIVKNGIGFSLPTFILHFYTKQTMKKYLKVLKKILENK